MSDALATIFSRSDAFKRKLIDALRNPGDTLRNVRDNVADDVRGARQLVSAAVDEDLANGGRMTYGPANQRAAQAIADAYNVSGMTVKYPQAEALETARRNAVKMLGLPENNTAMDRAKALGFGESGFHGTARDMASYDHTLAKGAGSGSREGPLGAWLADDPRVAGEFADWSARGQGGQAVYPLMIRGTKPYEPTKYADIKAVVDANTKFARPDLGVRMMQDKVDIDAARRQIQSMGDYVALRNTGTDSVDKPITQFLVTDPSRLRSRFAAFDPARVNENDLLGRTTLPMAATLATGAGAAAVIDALRDKKKKDEKK